MSLTAAAVTELRLELSTLTLWDEFLRTFFDGASHTVGGNAAVTFPTVELRFNQSAVTQPLNGVAITLTWVKPTAFTLEWNTVSGARQQRASGSCTWLFWIRAQLVSSGGGNSSAQAQGAADKLFGVLNNGHAVRPLAEKGIRHLKPESPQAISDGMYAMRLVSCRGVVNFTVRSQV